MIQGLVFRMYGFLLATSVQLLFYSFADNRKTRDGGPDRAALLWAAVGFWELASELRVGQGLYTAFGGRGASVWRRRRDQLRTMPRQAVMTCSCVATKSSTSR